MRPLIIELGLRKKETARSHKSMSLYAIDFDSVNLHESLCSARPATGPHIRVFASS